MFNQVILTGRLAKNPEMIPSQKITLCKIVIAVQKQFRNPDGSTPDPNFFEVKCWNAIGENVFEHVKKGDLVLVKGRLEMAKYKTKHDEIVNKIEVIGDSVLFMSKSKQNYEIGNDNDDDLEEVE